jgi:hypothetical protein
MRASRIGLLALFALACAAACSLVVHGNDLQCRNTSECARFPGTVCKNAVCVTPSGTTSGSASTTGTGGSCAGDSGCYACTPENEQELLNACTDAQCERFDSARLTNLTADGGLPALP